MKHKTADLSGALLDAAVAKAEGREVYFGNSRLDDGVWRTPNECWRDGSHWPVKRASTDWSEGGPIIERERIDVLALRDGWAAGFEYYEDGIFMQFGTHGCPTPLIAAMRAFVASKFGEEVELP